VFGLSTGAQAPRAITQTATDAAVIAAESFITISIGKKEGSHDVFVLMCDHKLPTHSNDPM
jgi:hypothetical protein